MSVKIKDFTPTIVATTKQRASLALRYMLDRIDEVSEPKTPRKFGNLRRDKLKQVLGLRATIIWVKNYAAAQEAGTTRGIRMVNYTTPGTGPHFAENAVKKVVDTVHQDFKRAGLI